MVEVMTRPVLALVCQGCGGTFEARESWRRACSPECFESLKPTPRIRRARFTVGHRQRLDKAPGLDEDQRRALREKFIRQGRLCVYCGERKGDTLDHVLPLAVGGTNYEGNLVPCCRSCNSRKSSLLVAEFKLGRLTPMQLRFKWKKP